MVQVIGAKGKISMKKKIKYTDEPMGKTERVKDFLPPPEKLVLKRDSVKITMSLNRSSVEFFKHQAKKHHTQYQKMIRNLLDEYVAQHNK